MRKVKEKPTEATTPPPLPSTVTGAKAIAALVAKPFTITFTFAGQQCELQARYLLPFEVELLQILNTEVGPPPLLPTPKGATPPTNAADPLGGYDWMDKGFQERKLKADRKQRDLAVFWGCEDIRSMYVEEAKPNGEAAVTQAAKLVNDRYMPVNFPIISSWMERNFIDEVIVDIYEQIAKTPISVAQTVNLS
jgi:hypothetical protein